MGLRGTAVKRQEPLLLDLFAQERIFAAAKTSAQLGNLPSGCFRHIVIQVAWPRGKLTLAMNAHRVLRSECVDCSAPRVGLAHRSRISPIFSTLAARNEFMMVRSFSSHRAPNPLRAPHAMR
jgi:hypothetical protein